MFNPKYTITNKLLMNVSIIEAAKEIIINAPLIPAWERSFREEALVRSVHFSTQIEGNEITLEDTKNLLKKNELDPKYSREVREVINYREAMDYVSDNFKYPTLLNITRDVLFDVHKILVSKIVPSDQAGVYRKVNVNLINSKTGEIGYSPPSFQEVPQLIEDMLTWGTSKEVYMISPIIKAGIIHYAISAIHPFTEGNGRTARVIATLSLFKDGYDIKSFFSLDEYYAKDAERYYAKLRETDQTNDLTGWLEYFSEGLAQELSKVKEKILNISKDVHLKNKFGQIPLNDRQIKILSYIEEHGKIVNKDWRLLFPQVSDDTILRDIKYLLTRSVVVKMGSTKSAVYVLA